MDATRATKRGASGRRSGLGDSLGRERSLLGQLGSVFGGDGRRVVALEVLEDRDQALRAAEIRRALGDGRRRRAPGEEQQDDSCKGQQ